MSSIVASCKRGYKLGIRSGNSDCAMWCLNAAETSMPYQVGKKLSTIAESSSKNVPQMEGLRQQSQMWVTRISWQLVLNLMGDAGDHLVLEGKALTTEDYEKHFDDSLKVMKQWAELELFLFYGEYKLAAKVALDRGDADHFFSGHMTFFENFHRCLALYGMARQTKHRKYCRPANMLRKRIHQWAEAGNPNIKHYDCLLQAEQAALDGKYDVSEKEHKEAIKLAARTGHLHHAGLFNERYADLLKNHVGNEEEAAYRLKEAIRWYEEWGAELKVKMLK